MWLWTRYFHPFLRVTATLSLLTSFTPLCGGASAQTIHQTADFHLPLPAGWKVRSLPSIGKAPRDLRRWELLPPARPAPATFDIEVDRTENLGRFPVKVARTRAQRLAQKFGYQQYRQQGLLLKGAPGFYEAWIAETSDRPKFRVYAAVAFYKGAQVRIAAVESPASETNHVEAELHRLLSRWAWKR